MNTNSQSLAIGLVALLVGGCAGWMVRGIATYNTGMDTSVAYEDWRVTCPSAKTTDGACAMVSAINDPGSKQPIASVSITKDPKQQQVIGFTLPLGVALEPGIGVQIGKDPLKQYPYRTCNQQGCVVVVTPADDKMIASLAAAGPNDVKVYAVGAGPDAKPVPLPVSLKGFSVARAAYLGNERRRHQWFWRLWS